MRVSAIFKAALIVLGLVVIGGGMNMSCSLMNESNDTAVAIGAVGTAGGWVGLFLLGRLAHRLGHRELERLRPKDEGEESKSGDDV